MFRRIFWRHLLEKIKKVRSHLLIHSILYRDPKKKIKNIVVSSITACPKHQPQIPKSQSSISFVATMRKNHDMATVAHVYNNPAKHILWNISRHFESTAYGSSFTFSGGESVSLNLFVGSPKCAVLEQCLMKWQTNRVH